MKLMLKASAKLEASLPLRREKAPILVADLTQIFLHLSWKGPERKAVRDLAVVAFWGMARMSELTYSSP
jgi:hypothetical protein